ncbi:MAG: hypothetical protein QQN41_08605 [Nitrosopumilus sp.]
MTIAKEIGIIQAETKNKQLAQLVGGKHLLDNRALKIFIIIVIVGIFAVGIVKAYGQFEEVPFDYQNSGCTLVENTLEYKRYECFADWRSSDYKEPGEEKTPAEDGCSSGFDIDYLTGECRPHEIIEEEAILLCEEDPDCPRGFYIPTAEKTKWEIELDKVDNREDSYSKDELVKLINEMLDNPSQCYQGVGTTAGSQEKRSFDIPTFYEAVWEYNEDGILYDTGKTKLVLDTRTEITERNLRGMLGQIVKDARECAAQIVLLNPQGGIMSSADANFAYCDTVDLKDTSQQLQCGKTYNHQTNADKVPIWSQQRVNEQQNRDIDWHQWNIVDDVCNGYYERSYKMVFQECIDYFREQGLVQETYAKRQQMKYYDDSAYQNFLEFGDEDQRDKIREDRLQKKIQQAYREYNAFKDQ